MNTNATDQLYDNGVLLGALLRITGLSVFDVQAIIQGNLILKNKHDNVRALILEECEWRSWFSLKIQKNGIKLDDIRNIFGLDFSEAEFNNNLFNHNFFLNQINFSLKEFQPQRKKMIKLLKDNYKFSNNQIASFLDISASTVGKE